MLNDVMKSIDQLSPSLAYPKFSSLDWAAMTVDFINKKLLEVAKHPSFSMDFKSASANQFLVYRGENCFLSLNLLELEETEPDFFDSSSRHMFIHVVGAGKVILKVFRIPENQKNEIFDASQAVEFSHYEVLQSGQSYWLNPDKEIVTYSRVEGAVATLHLVFDQSLPLVWHYDSVTLLPIECSAGEAHASRSEFCLQLLAELPGESLSEEVYEVLEEVSRKAQHFLRWEAVRTLLVLNESRGQALVQERLSDEHLHVREAAAQTLEILKTQGKG